MPTMTPGSSIWSIRSPLIIFRHLDDDHRFQRMHPLAAVNTYLLDHASAWAADLAHLHDRLSLLQFQIGDPDCFFLAHAFVDVAHPGQFCSAHILNAHSPFVLV